MEFGQLEAFVQVAKLGSFSRAAEALFLTQPSVTARIQTLEKDLGEDLFERGGRSIKLSDAGAVFLEYAERALKEVQESRDALESLRNASAGHLRIASAMTISAYVLPRLLKSFRSSYPGVAVSVRTGRSDFVMDMVLADEAQVGLVRGLHHPELETVHLYDDEVVLVTHPDHEFATRGCASIDAVGRQPLIFFDKGSSYHGLIHGYFRDAGIIPTHSMELDSIEATKKMVEEGLGIAYLPRVSVEREISLGVLVEVEVSGAEPLRRPIALITRRSRRHSRPVEAFIELLQSSLKAEPGANGLPLNESAARLPVNTMVRAGKTTNG
jgi:DNA-binding transcriptional LysR family regulator